MIITKSKYISEFANLVKYFNLNVAKIYNCISKH